jgi:hypothetical protein
LCGNLPFEATVVAEMFINASSQKEADMNRRNFLSTIGMGAAGSIALPAIARASTKGASDIALLREILTTLHPGLYRYASPKGIDAGLKALERDWAKQDLKTRYLALARFLATIKCGHSYPNFFNQSGAVKKALFDPDQPTRLPFAFKWLGSQMVITQDQSGTASLKRGTIVKAVNTVSAQKILNRLMPYVRADGSNDAKRRALLSISSSESIQTFDVFYGLLYGPPGSSRGEPKTGYHRLHIREPGAQRDAWIDVPAITMTQRQSFIKMPETRGDAPMWEWTMRPDGIAVLRMESWAVFNSKWKWEDWLNTHLDELKGANGLIVDIRENEGGLSCGDLLLARLANKDIPLPFPRQLLRYKKVPEHLNQYLDTWDDSFRDRGDNLLRVDDRFYEQVRTEGNPVIKTKGPRIEVPMVALVGPQNSSATFQFALKCRQSGLGTLIGETTGGNLRGINGGYFFATLPESGIEFDVALIGFFPDGPIPPDAGLEPDIRIKPNAKDIASGNDQAMNAAIAYLKTN